MASPEFDGLRACFCGVKNKKYQRVFCILSIKRAEVLFIEFVYEWVLCILTGRVPLD
jgi:hypothetical protein